MQREGESGMAETAGRLASRRAVLTAAIAGAVAWAGSALGRTADVRAGSDGDVVLGGANTTSGVTSITNAGDDAIVGRSGAKTHSGVWGDNSGGGYGVSGSTGGADSAGVWGNNSTSGPGVRGSSANGPGVRAESTHNATFSQSTGADYAGVWGDNSAGGYGVYGTTSGAGTGVWGDNGAGGPGVVGSSKTGRGVVGSSDSGVGVTAKSTGGTALAVDGKVRFSRSGKTTIPAGKKSIKITVAGLTPGSLVLANLAALAAGRYVLAAVPKAGSFTVYLNDAVAAATPVAWFVIDA
jgi:hypothetical protein